METLLEGAYHIGHLEEVFCLMNSPLPENPSDQFIISSQGGRVTGRGLSSRGCSPTFEQNDGFARGRSQLKETTALNERFKIEADHLGGRVFEKVYEKLRLFHITLISDGE